MVSSIGSLVASTVVGVGMGLDTASIGASPSLSVSRPHSPTIGEKIRKNLAGVSAEREKPKEVRDREKVERRLTEVRRRYNVSLCTHKICL